MTKARDLANLVSSSTDDFLVLGKDTDTSTQLVVQSDDTANAVASVRLMSRDGSNVNKTTNISNEAGVVKLDSDTLISTTTQNQLRLENTAANSLGSYLKIRDGDSTANQYTWIGRSSNDTYVYANNSDLAMKITGGSTNGGIVTKPNQPCFGARGYSGTTTQILSGYNPLLWSNVHTNVGNCFNNSTGKFTFPVSGRYYYECNMNLKSADNNWLGLYFIYNTSVQQNSWSRDAMNTDYNDTIVSGVVDATANDYMSFGWHASYVGPQTNNTTYNYANVYLIG